MTTTTADVLVIGGGPAGAAAAARLAAGRLRVVLCERQAAPHPQVCGEFISAVAAAELGDLGIALPETGAWPIGRTRILIAGAKTTARLPFTAYGLSRTRLDVILRALAERRGAEVRGGATVRSLRRVGGVWCAALADGARIESGTVVLATGKHDLREHARPGHQGPSLVAFKMHCRLRPDQAEAVGDAVELHVFGGGYAGLQLVESGAANLCFVIAVEDARGGDRPWPTALAHLRRSAPVLDHRLRDARPLWARPASIARIPYGYLCTDADAERGLYRVGDQAAVIPSLAGEGIAIALRSARLAADAVLAGEEADRYVAALRRDVLWPLRRARMIEAAMRPLARTFGMAAAMPGLVPALAGLTRLPR